MGGGQRRGLRGRLLCSESSGRSKRRCALGAAHGKTETHRGKPEAFAALGNQQGRKRRGNQELRRDFGGVGWHHGGARRLGGGSAFSGCVYSSKNGEMCHTSFRALKELFLGSFR